jgi:CheY-like chemotaxis protein
VKGKGLGTRGWGFGDEADDLPSWFGVVSAPATFLVDRRLMGILFLTTDLMFSSRVAGAAARAGMTMRTVGSAAALLEQVAAVEAPPFVLLDLNMLEFDPRQLVPALRAASNPPRAIVAYGPHVHEDRLAAATAAGCDEVLTRGQFNARMDDVLAKWRATSGE